MFTRNAFFLLCATFGLVPSLLLAGNAKVESFDLKVVEGADGAFAFYTDDSWHVAPNLIEVSSVTRAKKVIYSHEFGSEDEVLTGRKTMEGEYVYTDRRLQMFPCGTEHWMTAYRSFESFRVSSWHVSVWELRSGESKMLPPREAERYLASFGVSPDMTIIGCVDGRVYYVPSRDSDKADIKAIYWKNIVTHVGGKIALPSKMGEVDGVMVNPEGNLCVAGWVKIHFVDQVRTMGFAGGVDAGVLKLNLKCSRPNQSLEPMARSVTPRACARVAPALAMAHH